MSAEEKHRRFTEMGIAFRVMDFSAICHLSPQEFFQRILREYHPAVLATGFNFRFGKGAVGDTVLLRRLCAENNIEYLEIPPVYYGEEPISSTRIRQAFAEGNIDLVTAMLGRYFSYTAPVIAGDKRGRTLGFPTLNQAYPKENVLPRFGVYAGFTEIGGKRYASVTNIGKRPTFQSDIVLSETHMMDYEGDAYGKEATVQLVSFLREEKRFDGAEALREAIVADITLAIERLKGI